VLEAAAPPAGTDIRSRPAKDSDGLLVGANGQAFPQGTSPAQGSTEGPLIYVNGQGTPPASSTRNMQAVANATGAGVVGINNATESVLGDTWQSLNDKSDNGHNPAVNTTADLIYAALKRGEPVRLMGHSQRALIISRALGDVQERLRAEGMSEQQVKALLGNVAVESQGGAASSYPDGPTYTHSINQADFVPRELGLGETNPPFFDLTPNKLGVDTHPGEGARVIQFEEGSRDDRLNPAARAHDLLDWPTSVSFGLRHGEFLSICVTNAAFPSYSTHSRPSLMRLPVGIPGALR
jgi:hypothetical protein